MRADNMPIPFNPQFNGPLFNDDPEQTIEWCVVEIKKLRRRVAELESKQPVERKP